MRLRTPIAFSGLLVGLLIAGLVFAGASFATRGTTASTDDPLSRTSHRFNGINVSGNVVPDNPRAPSAYTLDFIVDFAAPNPEAFAPNGVPGDVVIAQSMQYPTLSDQREFVGPLALPFRSQTLTLQVKVLGECFRPVEAGGWKMTSRNAKCIQAKLILDGNAFNVSDLFQKVRFRLKMTNEKLGHWRLRSVASFSDPGYAFPIASLGKGGHSTIVIGDLGERIPVGSAGFKGTDEELQ